MLVYAVHDNMADSLATYNIICLNDSPCDLKHIIDEYGYEACTLYVDKVTKGNEPQGNN